MDKQLTEVQERYIGAIRDGFRNPFERQIKQLDTSKCIPPGVIEASIFVYDTLETARAAAESLWGDDAKPEHTLNVYKLIVAALPPLKGWSSD